MLGYGPFSRLGESFAVLMIKTLAISIPLLARFGASERGHIAPSESKYITGKALLVGVKGEGLNSKRSVRAFMRRMKQVESLNTRVEEKIARLEDLINGLSATDDSNRAVKTSRPGK